jgi:hypothetical protein
MSPTASFAATLSGFIACVPAVGLPDSRSFLPSRRNVTPRLRVRGRFMLQFGADLRGRASTQVRHAPQAQTLGDGGETLAAGGQEAAQELP